VGLVLRAPPYRSFRRWSGRCGGTLVVAAVPVLTTSVRIYLAFVAFLFLAISSGCEPDEAIRPFGRAPLGTSTGGDGGDAVSGRGIGGSNGSATGSLTVAPGTGGVGGTGSAEGATGGTVGSGGADSGGGSASGGAVASGGSVGRGGRPGSGGTIASGTGGTVGVGTGGATGGGGAASTGGIIGTSAACQKHIVDYDTELQKVRMCRNDTAQGCALLYPQRLAGCGRACLTYVDKAGKLDQIEKQWAMDGCTAAPCPLEICINPVSSSCSVATGLCTDSIL
jgi:hypothetical protein